MGKCIQNGTQRERILGNRCASYSNHAGVTIAIMSPAPFTPEKECYTVLILQFFRETLIQAESAFSCKR
jgi:hypothetical protein